MNFFVEGLQGSGKSTLVNRLSEIHPDYQVLREGDYSPVELAWCAYMTQEKYQGILERYESLRQEILEKTHEEGDRKIVRYTQIRTDVPGFYQDLEQYEIYNNRVDFEEWKRIILSRYAAWNSDKNIFECSLFQNIVEDMILFRCASDEEIIEFYREIKETLKGHEYRIFYLKTEDIPANIGVIRKERSDDQGNELWFPMMIGYFNDSPYAKQYGISGEEGLMAHLKHRQELELRLMKEVFPDNHTVLLSKKYGDIREAAEA